MTDASRFGCLLMACFLVSCRGGGVDSVSNRDPGRIRKSPELKVPVNDWPWWSGPTRNFVARAGSIPTEFGEDRNCQWVYSIQGEGHSSPIVIGDRVCLTVADPKASTKSLVCLNRQSGRQEWVTEIHSGPFMHCHGKNSQASASPASDGKRVYVAFMFDKGIQVSAVDLSGALLWQARAGNFSSRHGFGSSLVLYRSLVIVAGDNPGSGFLSALDSSSGEIVWRIRRRNESSYSTPAIARLGGKDQLLISGAGRVHGYDPVTGEELWSSEGPAKTTANTVLTDGTMVFAGGGYPENRFVCVDPGKGELRWEVRLKNYVPSPLLAEKAVIVPQDGGILSSLDRGTGEVNWKIRLGQDLSGSAVLLGERLYLCGEKGTVFVVSLQGRVIARNRLNGRILSTPVICGNQLWVRSAEALFCFSNPTIEKIN
ncbi:MAG: PQQ-binding-like beta-propeller repeat protein [Planctomycetota bacterium]|nr:PQQ-binding-like beta-propeller repeat protein [Planctomycetota bacterium]